MHISIRNPQSKIRNGFSLVELLVVIGIIVLLIAFTIPVVSKVKTSAEEASTKGLIQALDGAIQNYYGQFHGYPGPIPDKAIHLGTNVGNEFFFNEFKVATNASGYDVSGASELTLSQKITGAENLVLGLMGGLRVQVSSDPSDDVLLYDPTSVGQGPNSLNRNNPQRLSGALADSKDLGWQTVNGLKTGKFADEAGSADDSMIPEFVDKFSAGPMPILYMRARQGAKKTTAEAVPATKQNNGVINDVTPASDVRLPTQQYDLNQIIAYTGSAIGQSKSVKRTEYAGGRNYLEHGLRDVDLTKKLDKQDTTVYQYPYNAYAYFLNPNIPNTPRNKDGYILISAGRDRVYGTNDDITNFGPVRP